MKRTELREQIFKLLFAAEFSTPEEMPVQFDFYFEGLTGAGQKDQEYIREKTTAAAACMEELDKLINEHTSGWKTSRMNKVDLTILRLAVYEMKKDEDVPQSVAINEAVELAKKYSGGDGPSFINGVLAKIAE